MSKIDAYIDNIYKGFDKSDKEVRQLKEEMKSHLYDKVAELKVEGYSEEESVKIAIKTFGEEDNVSNELNQVIRKQNNVFKFLTVLAVFSFILAFISLVAGWVTEKTALENWEKIKPITADVVVKESILPSLNKQENVNEATKTGLIEMLDDYNEKNHNGLYYVKVTKDKNVVFEYSRDVPKEMVINEGWSSTTDQSGLAVEYKTTDFEQMRQYAAWESRIDISEADNLPHNQLVKISFQLFFGFWILMLVHFIQRTFLDSKPNRLFGMLLVIETFLVFVPLTFADHKDFIIISVVASTLINLIYLKKKSPQKAV